MDNQNSVNNTLNVIKKNYVTFFLLFLNIAAYILYTILGDMLYNIGSLSALDITEKQEYYRLISCMFLHGGLDHLISNMLFLVILGEMLEQMIGHAWFAVIYLLSGVGSGLFSMGYEILTGSFYHSIGASGAVCGLIGALLVVVIRNNGNYKQLSLRRMLFAIFYLVYTGLRSPIVNNAAHIGGLIVGFLLMLLLYKHICDKGSCEHKGI